MRGKWLATVLAALLPWTAKAAAPFEPTTLMAQPYSYGPDPLQTLHLYLPDLTQPAPLIIFIHGGGWRSGSKAMGERSQPEHFIGRGYAWATIDYRLVPNATVEEQAADVAKAVAWLRAHAGEFRVDPRRIVLMGHSAGGHLAALVATDPQWLAREGLAPDGLRAVVTLDAAGLDVVTAMAPGGRASGYHRSAFGDDAARQARLSPTMHVAVPNARFWLMAIDIDNSPAFAAHAATLAAGLAGAGADARVVAIDGTTHMRMLNELGQAEDRTTAAIDAFLDEVLAR